MRKFVQAGYLFHVAALLFFVAAAFAERPSIYIVLGAANLVTGFATKRASMKKEPGPTENSGNVSNTSANGG
jgi:hypothetical protein